MAASTGRMADAVLPEPRLAKDERMAGEYLAWNIARGPVQHAPTGGS